MQNATSTPWDDLVPSLAEVAVQELQKAIQSAFVEADDTLFKLAENGNYSNEHMDSVRILRHNKQQLLKQWVEKEKRCFLSWGRPEQQGDKGLELCLVEFEEMEETLAVQQMAASFEKSHSPLFEMMEQVWQKAWIELNPDHKNGGIEKNFGSLTNSHETHEIPSSNDDPDGPPNQKMHEAVSEAPLQPRGIAQSISSWLSETDIPMVSKVVLLKIMERELNSHLEGLLRKALDIFTNAGWKIVSPQEALKAGRKTQANHLRHEEVVEEPHANQEEHQPTSATPPNKWLDTVHNDENVSLPPLESISDVSNIHEEREVLDELVNEDVESHAHKELFQDADSTWTNIKIPRFDFDIASLGEEPTRNMNAHDKGGQGSGTSKLRPVVSDDMADAFARALYQLMGPGNWVRQYEMEGNILNEEIGEENWDTNLSDFLALLQKRRIYSSRKPKLKHLSTLDSQTVREILKSLQHTPPSVLKDAVEGKAIDEEGFELSFAHIVKREILDLADKEHGINQEGAVLADNDEDAVDVVGMVFEVFLRDRNIHETVRHKIIHLVPSYVRIALNDRKMFMNKKHAARKFLDMVAKACEGNTGETLGDKAILTEVNKGIEKILQEFEEDSSVFDEVTENLKKVFLEQQELVQKIQQRSVESLRSEERLEMAEAKSREVFVEHVANSKWPSTTIDTLEKHWCQYYRILFLQSQNPNSNPEKSKRNMLDAVDLLKTLVNIGNTGIVKIFETPTLAHKLHNDMSVMLASSGLVDTAGQEACAELLSLLDQAHRWNGLARDGGIHNVVDTMMETLTPLPPPPEPVKEVEKAVWVNPEVIKKHQRRITAGDFPTDQDLIDYFSSMPLDTWVDFVKPDGSLIPAKLQFVSPISMRLIFVTLKGFKHAVESPQGLAIMVKLDKLRLREYAVGEQGFEHSFKKAIEKLDAGIPDNENEGGVPTPQA